MRIVVSLLALLVPTAGCMGPPTCSCDCSDHDHDDAEPAAPYKAHESECPDCFPRSTLLPPLSKRKIRAAIRKKKDGCDGTPTITHRAFFGNLHSHTSYSDGRGTPDQAYAHAQGQGQMHFLAITEHNHRGAGRANGRRIADHNERYTGPRNDALIPLANRATTNDQFVALYGQEVSSISRGNHVNAFDVPAVVSETMVANGAFDTLLNTWIPTNLDSTGQHAVLQLNHPWSRSSPNAIEYGRDDFNTFNAWRTALDTRAQLMEVINGPSHSNARGVAPATVSDSEWRRYLNMGFHLAPTANQDNHFRTWGTITNARTALVTTSLTKQNLLTAMRNRNAYATLDRDLTVVGRVQGELLGAIVPRPQNGTPLNIEIRIHDQSEPIGTYFIEVFADRIDGATGDRRATLVETYGPIDTADSVPENNIWELPGLNYANWDYIYMRVVQGTTRRNGRQAWLAPTWFR